MLALLLSTFVYGVLGAFCDGYSFLMQDCALVSFKDNFIHYKVTDGAELVTSLWDPSRQLVTCSLNEDAATVSSFLSHCRSTRQVDVWDYGFGRFAEARMTCAIFLGADTPKKGGYPTGRRVKRGFTYPGTLWCGVGNNAATLSDLGEHQETDSCCRTHDHCEHVIHPFTYNYGYRNYLWHTISHCECDNRFKNCLRRVNDTASRVVGQAFFNVIQVQCFEFTSQELCVERHWYGWCKRYKNETVAVLRESGLYDYGGNIIDDPVKSTEEDSSQLPSLELPPGQPTIGQVMQATEDLLKIMMTISPTTSPDQTTTEKATKKKKDKTKQKERKNKKGKGLKGKRKNRLNKENKKSPSKDIWGEERGSMANTPLDSILDIGHKQDPFNDILNDEPMRNVDTTKTTIAPTIKQEALKSMTTSLPQELRPCAEKPKRKNRKEGKDRRERRKKHRPAPCIPAGI
ncbi:protein PROCA1 [Dendropsophus ebraccatus]|uniref:protein PROCA1 n=1 Tax=Dendropsophus ebraccatus TaxID=150705 RepID=UPI003831AEEE